MSNSKISALTASTTPLAGTETLPIVQSSTTKQVSVANLTAGRAVSASSLTTTGNVTVTGSSVYGGGSYIQIAPSSTDTNSLTVRAAGNITGTISGTDIITVASTGLSVAGNITPSIAAKGINFTANTPASGMTSQLLNWYEEGTFTPTFGNLTIGNGSVWGAYVRSGKVVEVTLGFTWGSTSSIAGTIGNISGLPFSVQAPNGQAFPLVVGTVYKAGVGWFNIVSILSGTSLIATTTFAGTGISSVSPAALASNDSLTLSATYRAA